MLNVVSATKDRLKMFAKLGGARVFSTIDLRSAYYHIGLTRESQAKSAFVVPMGKWQFKRTPFWTQSSPSIISNYL